MQNSYVNLRRIDLIKVNMLTEGQKTYFFKKEKVSNS